MSFGVSMGVGMQLSNKKVVNKGFRVGWLVNVQFCKCVFVILCVVFSVDLCGAFGVGMQLFDC